MQEDFTVHRPSRFLAPALLPFMLLSFSAHAEGIVTVGAIGGFNTSPYKDSRHDYKGGGAPVLRYDAERYYIGFDGIGFRLFSKERDGLTFSSSIFLTRGNEGFRNSESPYFKGLRRRKDHSDAGIEFTVVSPIGATSLAMKQEISGHTDGGQVSLSHGVPFQFGNVEFAPQLRLDYLSGNLVDYYYGVWAAEVAPDREEYHPGHAFQPSLGYTLTVPLNEKKSMSLIQGAEHLILSKQLTDSPLIDKGHITSVYVGFTYSF
jgi:outer membrane protein